MLAPGSTLTTLHSETSTRLPRGQTTQWFGKSMGQGSKKLEKFSFSELPQNFGIGKICFCVLQFILAYTLLLVVGKGVGHINFLVFLAFESL